MNTFNNSPSDIVKSNTVFPLIVGSGASTNFEGVLQFKMSKSQIVLSILEELPCQKQKLMLYKFMFDISLVK